MIGEGKERTTKNTKTYSKPVAEDNVDETEGEGASKDHGPPVAE